MAPWLFFCFEIGVLIIIFFIGGYGVFFFGGGKLQMTPTWIPADSI